MTITPDQTLADLAVTSAGAARVFHHHGLDFCCHGRSTTLAAGCEARGIDVEALIAEIEQAAAAPSDEFERWDEKALDQLIEYILARFHESHRAEFPRLLEMACKVERVHAEKPTCPHGLADHIEAMAAELEMHMQKEEQVLFPMICSGRGAMAAMPIQVMEHEHREAGAHLARLRELAHDYEPPAEACATWKALYEGLADFERELMQHIHLENNVLHPRALGGG